jgi:predicted TIM-barrel fold metal-dependent hydrolase
MSWNGRVRYSRGILEPLENFEMTNVNGSNAGPHRRAVLRLAVAAASTSGILGIRQLTRGSLTQEKEPMSPIIDTHIHAVTSALPGLKPKPPEIEKLYQDRPEAMADRLKAEMVAGRVEMAFGMGSLGGTIEDPLGIARTLDLCSLVPGLRAIGIADPRRTDAAWLKAVEAQIVGNRSKIVAFKAYLGYLHFGPEAPGYIPYYKLAEKYDLPVIVHTGDNWSTTAKVKYAHPLRMDEVAVDFPEVRFVLAHFGNPWLTDAAEVIFKNPNVWADLSGLFVGGDEEIQAILGEAKIPDSAPGLLITDLKKAIGYVGDPRKFLYGSDWPLAPMGSYRRLIESLIPAQHHQDVFMNNARNVFRNGMDKVPKGIKEK